MTDLKATEHVDVSWIDADPCGGPASAATAAAVFDASFERNGTSVPTTCGDACCLTRAQREVIYYLSSPLLLPYMVTVSVSQRSVDALQGLSPWQPRSLSCGGEPKEKKSPKSQRTRKWEGGDGALLAKAVRPSGSIPKLSVLALGA
eukprot:5606039-Pleurochrysis_carterae.AAC.1